MRVVVKRRRTEGGEFKLEGDIPPKVMSFLRREYGDRVAVTSPDDDTLDISESEWFLQMRQASHPGVAIRVYRENRRLTQEELGKQLGGLSRQRVCDIERGKRNVTIPMAKRLADFFGVPIERFI